MPAPRTYTAEDVAELHGHGGVVNLRRLLRAVIDAGARPAERGEFTLRAFLNGRIDLSQAEAVLDVVDARSEAALDLAHEQLRGGLGERVRTIRVPLLNVLARLEVQIDFVEEDLGPVHGAIPTAELATVLEQTRALASTFDRGRVLRRGARVVLLGAPNAGKSSLFNALLRQSRAIVTETPGTTRDFIEEVVDLGGLSVVLVDTAGLRAETADPVEREGMERSVALAREADLVLLLIDGAQPVTPVLSPDQVPGGRVLQLRTKADLGTGDVSAHTGEGLDALVERLRNRLLPEGAREADRVTVTSARHHTALVAATGALEAAHASCLRQEAPELVAVDVREGLDQLGLIIGETTTEDVLDRIFSEFCIGK